MNRHRSIRRALRTLALSPGVDPFEVECAFGEALMDAVPRALGLAVLPRLEVLSTIDDGCLRLPPDGALFIDTPAGARSLRPEERAAYEAAILDVASAVGLGAAGYGIEHMVCLAWDDFTPGTWSTFDAACAATPPWAGRRDGLPHWFGDGASLSGSVEPPGFHVVGLLPAAAFDAWLAAFLAACNDLPFRAG